MTYSNADADDMTVKVQYYDGRPMSTTVPYRVTCTVVEAQAPMKGLSVNPQYASTDLDIFFLCFPKSFMLIFCLVSFVLHQDFCNSCSSV